MSTQTILQAGQQWDEHGGAPGFLVPFLPHTTVPGGILLLPDFAGNGAFEAVGNILETKQATLIAPNYVAQVALCVSGVAYLIERESLNVKIAQLCRGAERIIALAVQRVEVQSGDWSATLAYESARAASMWTTHVASTCALK